MPGTPTHGSFVYVCRYYSMMTLVLLVVFESTVCTQRLRSLETLRGMRRPAYNVYAYRNATWQMLSTEALLPGDVVSLGRISTHQDEKAEGRGRVRSGSGSRRAIELQQQEVRTRSLSYLLVGRTSISITDIEERASAHALADYPASVFASA